MRNATKCSSSLCAAQGVFSGRKVSVASEPRSAATAQCHRAQADIWSSGVTLYMFAYGELPFMGSNSGEMMEHILKDEYARRAWLARCRG